MSHIPPARRMPAALALVGLLADCSASAPCAQAADAAPETGVLRATLDNGLRVVIVQELARAGGGDLGELPGRFR